MCGLFGLARPEEATGKRGTTRALLMLGRLAEERGVDSAGLAFWPTTRTAARPAVRPVTHPPARPAGQSPAGPGSRTAARPAAPPPARPMDQPDVTVDGWRVVKQVGRFGELPLRGIRRALDGARIVLGHTRHATQGNVDRLANTSPLMAGGLLGTHNGDVTAAPLAERYALPEPAGETDSELIFAALDGATSEAAMLEVLSGLAGRAALAWVDRRSPERLWLARAALSPLAVAVTTGGDLLWASNPDWLRRVAAGCGLALHPGSPALVPEGTLLAFDVGRRVRYAGSAEFTPRPRVSDLGLSWAIWRGFGTADRLADQAGLRSIATLAPARQPERPAA